MSVQLTPAPSTLRSTCRFCSVRTHAPCGAFWGEGGAETLESVHAPLRHIPAGATIVEQGAPSDRSFTVLNGWIALYQTTGDGRATILHFLLPGDVLPFERHSAVATRSAVAVGDVTVCSLSRSRQERLEREHPDYDARQKADAARDLHLAYENIAAIAFGSAKERIAHLLWSLASRTLRRAAQPSDRVWIPASQIQLGLATGLTPVHVSRTLRHLREAGLLDLEDHRLTIRDPAEMKRLAGASTEMMASWV
jgi:CRP/FNR family transcriptional regulator